MKRVLHSAVVSAVVLASMGSVASAGGYVGLGVGTAPSRDTQTSFVPDGRSGRLLVGHRIGMFAVEGDVTGYSLLAQSTPYSSVSAAVSGKLALPLGNNIEAFGRAGLERSWLSSNGPKMSTFSGDGYLLGAGLAYRLDLGLAGGSLWLDYTRHADTLAGDAGGKTFDQSNAMWTMGLTVGI
jgi:hypothetical protein